MNYQDTDFHLHIKPIMNAISIEGLRIAKQNRWGGLVIEITVSRPGLDGTASGVRCCLKNTVGDPEIDEPSASMLDAAIHLQNVFNSVGTPLAGATIDWVDEQGDGAFRPRWKFRYD